MMILDEQELQTNKFYAKNIWEENYINTLSLTVAMYRVQHQRHTT